MPDARVPESVLARIWNDGWHSREMRTASGRRLAIVYRGVWTHSDGPDFRDAMLEVDGRLVTGQVEMHVRSSDWFSHGHQDNPAYDSVVLHVVLEDDLTAPVHGPSGRGIETLNIAPFLKGPVEEYAAVFIPTNLGSLGEQACLPTLAGGRTDEVRSVLRNEGWRRLHAKRLRFQQEFQTLPPGEALYRGLLDSLGLTSNRLGMAALADAAPLSLIETTLARYGPVGCLAALVGAGGFLPLSPGHAAMVEEGGFQSLLVEDVWPQVAADMQVTQLPASVWSLNRVRPLNHPVRRLASMAWILTDSRKQGLLSTVLDRATASDDSWDLWLSQAQPSIGASRRHQILVNTFAPYLAAYADEIDDDGLRQRAFEIWDRLPGKVDDEVARKTLRQITGGRRFGIDRAIEVQGLHQIGRNGCKALRCFDCPIAELATRFEPAVNAGPDVVPFDRPSVREAPDPQFPRTHTSS